MQYGVRFEVFNLKYSRSRYCDKYATLPSGVPCSSELFLVWAQKGDTCGLCDRHHSDPESSGHPRCRAKHNMLVTWDVNTG